MLNGKWRNVKLADQVADQISSENNHCIYQYMQYNWAWLTNLSQHRLILNHKAWNNMTVKALDHSSDSVTLIKQSCCSSSRAVLFIGGSRLLFRCAEGWRSTPMRWHSRSSSCRNNRLSGNDAIRSNTYECDKWADFVIRHFKPNIRRLKRWTTF